MLSCMVRTTGANTCLKLHDMEENRKGTTAGITGARLEVEYFTDPLCCWSWSFEPQWRRLRYEFEGMLDWKYRMTGLLADWNSYNDPFNTVQKPVQMGPVWKEAMHISGMPVNDMLWARNPPSSSYPACFAVKTAELQGKEAMELYLRHVREAVMFNGRDVSKANVLIKLAEEVATKFPEIFDFVEFRDDFLAQKALDSFQQDLDRAKRCSVNRCPTLIIKPTMGRGVVITGYRTYDVLVSALQQVWKGELPVKEISSEGFREFWKGSLFPREEEEIVLQ